MAHVYDTLCLTKALPNLWGTHVVEDDFQPLDSLTLLSLGLAARYHCDIPVLKPAD